MNLESFNIAPGKFALICLAALGVSCSSSKERLAEVRSVQASSTQSATLEGHVLRGLATWYGETHQGRLTASGEPFDMNAWTAAHKTLPMGTVVKVTHMASLRTVQVQITDRGPYGPKRVIDLSRRAAEQLRMIDEGEAMVELEVLGVKPIPRARGRLRRLPIESAQPEASSDESIEETEGLNRPTE